MAKSKAKSSDAGLLAQGAKLESAIREWRRAFNKFTVAEDDLSAVSKRAYDSIPSIGVLYANVSDFRDFIAIPAIYDFMLQIPRDGGRVAYYFTPKTLPHIRDLRAKYQKKSNQLSVTPRMKKRVAEILAALERLAAKSSRNQARVDATDAVQTRLLTVVSKVARRILATDAVTLEGVMVKFRAASWDVWGEENPNAFTQKDYRPALAHEQDAGTLFTIAKDVAVITRKAAR